MGDESEPFIRCGKEEKRIEVSSDEVLKAIEMGRDVCISYADIQGELDVVEYFKKNGIRERVVEGAVLIRDSHIGHVDFQSFIFARNLSFQRTTFQAFAWFTACTFSKEAVFDKTVFKDGVEFLVTAFDGTAYFGGTEFCGSVANFNDAVFSGRPYFSKARFKKDAQFFGTRFERDPHLNEAVFCDIRPECFHSIGEAYRRSLLLSSASFFKRAGGGYEGKGEYLAASDSFRNAKVEYEKEGKYNEAGEMYVKEKESARLHLKAQKSNLIKRGWFWIWKHSSNYGESPWHFLRWIAVIVIVFALIYMPVIPKWFKWWPSITFKEYPFNEWSDGFVDGFLFNIVTAIYYSAVTFATLGVGDIAPASIVGKVCAIAEVLLGYLMFGVLITLVARKMTRS
jgi:hypothetical protein